MGSVSTSAWVPLPWCTSQSMISTRSRPGALGVARGDDHVVDQAEPHPPRGQGVVPRRPHRGKGVPAALQRVVHRGAHRAGRPEHRRPARVVQDGVEEERTAAPARSSLRVRADSASGCTASSASRPAAGALDTRARGSCRAVRAASPGARGSRDGPAPGSCLMQSGWVKTGTATSAPEQFARAPRVSSRSSGGPRRSPRAAADAARYEWKTRPEESSRHHADQASEVLAVHQSRVRSARPRRTPGRPRRGS